VCCGKRDVFYISDAFGPLQVFVFPGVYPDDVALFDELRDAELKPGLQDGRLVAG